MCQDNLTLRTVARLRCDFPTKFGIPRQSGLAAEVRGDIVFEPDFRNPDALRGLEGFSHLWLLWGFSANLREGWSPTVRPPRLGGNRRMGVFATRSPFRPNPIGLSCVRLDGIEPHTPEGPVLRVSGGDLMDGTPIYDIKPYLPYTDSRPGARGGFAEHVGAYELAVVIPPEHLDKIPADRRTALRDVLRQDPRPAYQDDPERVYGFAFAGLDIRFTVRDGTLTVCGVAGGEQRAAPRP